MSNLIIVGLGNPGPRYNGTRHNLGFDFVDEVARLSGVTLREDSEKISGVGSFKGVPISIVKPLTFMNRSGEPLRRFCEKKFSAQDGWGIKNLLVVHDELDLPVGTSRLKLGGGEGGHNGLRSISASFGSKDYLRLRLGIGKPAEDVTNWVLGRFTPDEKILVEQGLNRAVEGLEIFITSGLSKAQNWLNQI